MLEGQLRAALGRPPNSCYKELTLHLPSAGDDVYEAPIRPKTMNDLQRRQLVQKAKGDRLAYDAARLLSLGETDKAATVANEGVAIAGREQLALWLHHYATTRFKVASRTVNEFLDGVPSANVAL